ncbi:hypothetical protein CDD82_6603 [Ophiocordyceps australis]|uniref:Zn(2)-C6 fungal-type domain-containing protein n=1 Tax=Ophiocordyceps australis TaxID=1399860 RepID=A0A2C5XZJ8_9HYPO|nr:hypothetical protein CDD82_6603 [Ophiocordyceps australis]
MGRKPNSLILRYFERGPKLRDSSNRYPHTCRLCGENFPKGRLDALTTHITKKCPAIPESERLEACATLHGIPNTRAAIAVAAVSRGYQQLSSQHQTKTRSQHLSQTQSQNHTQLRACDQSQSQLGLQGWTALEALAEASRQVDLTENTSRGSAAQDSPSVSVAVPSLQPDSNTAQRFQVQEQYTLDNPPAGYDNRAQANRPDRDEDASQADCSPPALADATPHSPELTPEDRLGALLPVHDGPADSPMSVAAAAAARLTSSFLDPQLVHPQDSASSLSLGHSGTATEETQATSQPAADTSETQNSQPWGQMTYLTAPNVPCSMSRPSVPVPVNRGGVPMDTSGSPFLGRARHFRSKFSETRRQEVREVRRLGACIRCRILRKICSKGTPCDTCRKVLSPRIWMTGCVRSRLHEQLDLYSAGVQVVLSQNRINLHKEQLDLTDVKSIIDVSHFPDSGIFISLPTLAVLLEPEDGSTQVKDHQIIMINQDKEDIPARVEEYMRDVLRLFIDREPSRFTRVTLETAVDLLEETSDELLRKALELWGLAECIDRERQWSIIERVYGDEDRQRPVREAQSENDVDIYTMICMQLNAAAERKANTTSRALLNLMDRFLADSKTKASFTIYITSLIFLNCVEKSTWAFKAWEQQHLRPGWPLERDPGLFTQQGGTLANLLRMLLSIRKALPNTLRSSNGRLVALDEDPAVVSYFERLDLECWLPASNAKCSPPSSSLLTL